MKLTRSSIILLVVQLIIVSSIAAKYLYQRQSCPRVWTRSVAYDPELLMRGRYLSARLYVDACGLAAEKRKDTAEAAPNVPGNLDLADGSSYVQGRLAARGGKLAVIHIEKTVREKGDQALVWPKSNNCSEVQLWSPVDFYLSEKAKSPFPLRKGQELWVEVTVPPKGPPRPIQLALKQGAAWQPLAFQ